MSEQRQQKYPPSVQHGIPRLSVVQKGWKSAEIGKLVMEVVRPVEMDDDETYTLVTAKRSRGGIVRREKLKGYEIAVKNQFYIQAGDFIISKRQIVHGACGFVPEELNGAIVSNEYLVLNFTDKVIPQFWELLTHTIYFQQVCFYSSIGVHVEKMLFKVSRWYQWKVNIPTLKEQEKIASFLGAIDTRLTQLRRKHELLQTYKRGVMQKLFSQQIRFKCDRGKPFPDWENKRLEAIFSEFKSGYNITSDEITESGSYPVFGGNGMRGYSEKFTHDGFYFLIGRQGALCGNIHRSYGKAYISEHAIACKANDTSDTEWLAQRLNYYNLNKISESSAQPGLAANKLLRFKLLTPSKEEQEKIADFLTAIDQKIEAISQQINLTKQFKKGLLQKIFV